MSRYTRTLADITDDTFRLLRDFHGSRKDGKYWTWEEVLAKVKSSILDLVISTGVLKAIQSILIQKDIFIYELPADCVHLLRASVNGLAGRVVTPKHKSAYDFERSGLQGSFGDPETFFRDLLLPHQIGFVPGPNVAGATFERDSIYGLIRSISDNTAYLPYDAEAALRNIQTFDIKMITAGEGNIIRDLILPYGNIQVTYVRTPFIPESADGELDPEIPVYVHKDLKYGAAEFFLRSLQDDFAAQKRQYFQQKWYRMKTSLQRYSEYRGNLDNVRPG